MRSFEEEQLLLDGVTAPTQTVVTPSGDSNFGFTKQPTPGEGVREFYRKQGEQRVIDSLCSKMHNKICFDNFHGGCDHAACYAFFDLIDELKGEQK